MGLVADIHARSRGTYGMLRIRAALEREQNMIGNKKLILSIMRELGIKGFPGPKKREKNLVNQATPSRGGGWNGTTEPIPRIKEPILESWNRSSEQVKQNA